jgi:hypothetical protein
MRTAGGEEGGGFFLRTHHEPYAMAEVGILYISEVGLLNAYGSLGLASAFSMPCDVEVVNTETGASIDICLESDERRERPEPLIRLPRAVRKLLALERGQTVLIRPIVAVPEPERRRDRAVRPLLNAAEWLLIQLIGRRRIQLSLAPAHASDDEAGVARLDAEKFATLGINEGDYVKVSYRNRHVHRMALMRKPDAKAIDTDNPPVRVSYAEVPLDLQIALDAQARYRLSRGYHLEFGAVVQVERDMFFIFRKSLNLTLLPIVGTVVTVIALFGEVTAVTKVAVISLLFLVFYYLALSFERARVKSVPIQAEARERMHRDPST